VRIQRRIRSTSGKILTEDKRVRNATSSEKMHKLHDGHASTTDHSLTAKTWGPLGLVAIAGCIFSMVLLGLAIWKRDGFALIANITLSGLSSLVGYSGRWKLDLQKRVNTGRRVPPGDVVIRYPKGSFLVVSCDEDVARELFFAPENIKYHVKNQWQYRIISLIGTILLMFGVIFLANASTWMQIGFAIAYIVMNVLYWLVAALPSRIHWDTSCFKVSDQCIEVRAAVPKPFADENGEAVEKSDGLAAQLPRPAKTAKEGANPKFVDLNGTFTSALWKAILVTQSTEWVRLSGAAPDTEAWKEWLEEAKDMARTLGTQTTYQHKFAGEDNDPTLVYRLPQWNAGLALGKCLMKYSGADLEKNEPESNKQGTIAAIEQESNDC
jgi:hypothetical protein